MRSFSGLVATCGLDHILGSADGARPTPTTTRAARRCSHALHGRISTIPARLTGYGETWDGDRCLLWAEGVVQQATVFGEDLHLHRRIEAEVGGNAIRIADRVVNHGFHRTPHMFFYHVNVGWPLLEEGARYLAPIRDVVWASHADSLRRPGRRLPERAGAAPRLPRAGLAARARRRPGRREPGGLVNDRLGLGFEVVTRKDQLPCLYQWQNFQAGHYALGIEPSTHHVLGDLAARERGEMIWLEHGESRSYDMTMRVLDGPAEIAAAERRITAIARQPEDDFPPPSGNFPALAGRPRDRSAL